MGKKYNILLVHNYYQIKGGEDTVVSNEKKLLEEHGHKVFLYSRNNKEINEFNKLRKIMLPFTTIFSYKTFKDLNKIIKKNKIDIVHVHNTLTLVSPAVYYSALICNIPLVQTIHNFRMVCPSATFYRNGNICEECVTKNLFCAIKYSCYRNNRIQTLACVINTKIHRYLGIYKKINYICLTEFNKEKLLEINNKKAKIIDDAKIYVKPNFTIDSSEKNYNMKRKPQFVFAGRLDKAKGIDLLFDAWKNIDNLELIVCGTGPEEQWCKDYIIKNKIKSIKMIGLVDNKEVKKIISESKGLILPTQWYEGFPMSILESFSCGTPVIGSNIGNVGNLIIDGINGYKFDTIEELIEKINLLNEKDLSTSVRKHYKDKYSKKENYKCLMQIYNSVKK